MHRTATAGQPSRKHGARAGPRRLQRGAVMWLDALAGAGAAIVLALLVVAETRAPLRPRTRPRGERLAANAVVAVGAVLVVRVAVVPVGLGVAGAAERGGVGVLPWVAGAPPIAWAAGRLLLRHTMCRWPR